jgi:D-alanyl-D-alanine carboxypeptidase/D-alanyl-D-alanine-endopeptidase (penicillin-binding protein 4)
MRSLLPRRSGPALALAVALGLSALARTGGGQPEPPKPSAAPTEGPKSASPTAPAPPAPSPVAGEPIAAPGATRKTIDPAGVVEAVRKLSADVQRWGGSAGVLVVDVPTGAVLAASNEHAAFNPASNAKLVTAVAALRALGPQHRFLTGLYGKQAGDTVEELVLRGQGDPSLRMGDLAEMARELASAGVRKVRSIGVDQSYFDDRYAPPAYEQQPHEWAPFRAPVAAVSLNGNTVLFTVRPSEQGKSALLSVEPPGLVDLAGAVRTTAKSDPEKIALSLEPRGDRLAATFGGTLPEKSRPVRIARRVDDPRLLAGYALRAALKDAGIEATGGVHTAKSREKKLLASHRSEPLGELLTALGKESDNFYAEMIFKALSAPKKGEPATSEAGAEAAARILREVSAFEPGVVVKNGSGLFDANRATPWSMAALLRAAYSDPTISPEFVSHLAIGGVDGTLRGRFRKWSSYRAIRAKTGTLDAVAALSGYVLAPSSGSPVAFAILVNGVSGKIAESRRAMDAIVEAIALESWKSRR